MARKLREPYRTMAKRGGAKLLPHTPNYICILPPGKIIAEKLFEMGIDAAELAKRMNVEQEIVEQLIRYEIPLTGTLAKKLEKVTWMPARVMMKFESEYRKDWRYAMDHPEIPAYLGSTIINRPKRKQQKNRSSAG